MSFLDLFSTSPVKRVTAIGSLKIGGFLSTLALAAVDGYVFACGSKSSFHTIDVSIPSKPTIANTMVLPQDGLDVTVSGNRAYFATGIGILVYDITNPLSPKFVSKYDEIKYPQMIASCSNLVYACNVLGHISIIDASNPEDLKLIGLNTQINTARSICVIGKYAYYSGLGF